MNKEELRGARRVVEAFREVNRSLELHKTLEAILNGAESMFGCDAAGIYVMRPQGGRPVARLTRGYPKEPSEERGLVRKVLASGRPLLVTHMGDESQGTEGRPTSRSAVSAPIVGSRGRVRGAIVLESDEEGAYGPGSLELLTVYAAGVSGAIERAFLYARVVSDRRLESELVVARRVLAGLLPRETPHLDGFDIAAVIQPCFEVGGDYYDFIPLGKDRWGIAIADVVGKGVPAALLVAAMRASLYSLTAHELALRAVLDRANRFFYESAGLDGKYVTLFYAVMDIQARRLIYVNAGHLPPILLRRVGKVELLEEGGFPLGPFADPRYFEGFARLQTGDLLALYTDGIVEAMDENERHYGHERLVNILRELRSRTAAEICSEVIKDAGRFSHARPPDDQTVLIIKAT